MLSVTAGDNVVRLLPPLIVSDEEIRDALDRIRAAAGQLSAPLATAQ
jgi:acetylornithine/N-succinyldiaminopimelate aminotransferase